MSFLCNLINCGCSRHPVAQHVYCGVFVKIKWTDISFNKQTRIWCSVGGAYVYSKKWKLLFEKLVLNQAWVIKSDKISNRLGGTRSSVVFSFNSWRSTCVKVALSKVINKYLNFHLVTVTVVFTHHFIFSGLFLYLQAGGLCFLCKKMTQRETVGWT